MTKSLLLAKIAGVVLATFVTIGLLATVDHLAYEQHAAVQMAKSAATPATTAARSLDGQRI